MIVETIGVMNFWKSPGLSHAHEVQFQKYEGEGMSLV